jgi:hypothetical protein
MERRASILILKFGTTGRQSFQLYAPVAFYPQGNSLELISVRVFMTPGLLNVDRRNRSLEDFQRPYWESNPEPPVSPSSHSSYCTTVCLPLSTFSRTKGSNLCLNQSQLLKNIPKNNSKAL